MFSCLKQKLAMPFAELYRENIGLMKNLLQGERAGRGEDEDGGGLARLPSRLGGSQHEGAASVKILFAIKMAQYLLRERCTSNNQIQSQYIAKFK